MNDGPTGRMASEGGGVHRNCWPRSAAYDLKARAEEAESRLSSQTTRLKEAVEWLENEARKRRRTDTAPGDLAAPVQHDAIAAFRAASDRVRGVIEKESE